MGISITSIDGRTTISINEKTYEIEGKNISIRNNKIYSDGVEVKLEDSPLQDKVTKDIFVSVKGDTISNISSDCSIKVDGDITGNITAGNSIRIDGNTTGSMVAGNSVSVQGRHYE